MKYAEKQAYVEDLTARLKETPLVMLADYRGVTVSEIDALRRELEKKGVRYEVIKNTLGRRAIEGTDMEDIGQWLTDMTGWVISGDDPIATAKAVRDAIKDLNKAEKFEIKGGYFDGEALDAAAIKKVADLPSREELLVGLLRTIQEGPRQILGVLQAPARDLLYCSRTTRTSWLKTLASDSALAGQTRCAEAALSLPRPRQFPRTHIPSEKSQCPFLRTRSSTSSRTSS